MPTENAVRITVDQVDQSVRQSVRLADATRTAGLDVLLQLAQTREAGLRGELARLSQVLPVTDPRLQTLTSRLDGSEAMRKELTFEVLRSDTGMPRPVANAWTLTGFLRAIDPATLEGKSVVLLDIRGTVIPGTEVPIDNAGNFTTRVENSTPAPGHRAADEVFVAVLDAIHRVVYSEPRALVPEPDKVTSIEVQLSKLAAPTPTTAPSRSTPKPPDTTRKRPSAKRPEPNPNAEPAVTPPVPESGPARRGTKAKSSNRPAPRP